MAFHAVHADWGTVLPPAGPRVRAGVGSGVESPAARADHVRRVPAPDARRPDTRIPHVLFAEGTPAS